MKRNLTFAVTTLTDDATPCSVCPTTSPRHKADVHVTDLKQLRLFAAPCLQQLPNVIQQLHDQTLAKSVRAQASAHFWGD